MFLQQREGHERCIVSVLVVLLVPDDSQRDRQLARLSILGKSSDDQSICERESSYTIK